MEGNNNIHISCTDDTDVSPNADTSGTNVDLTYKLDTTPPRIILASPSDGTTTQNPNVRFIVNFTDDYGLENATLYVWDSVGKQISLTTDDLNGNVDILLDFVDLPFKEGTYRWSCYACDKAGNCDFSEDSFLTYSFGGTWGVRPLSIIVTKGINQAGVLEEVEVFNSEPGEMQFDIQSNNPSIVWPDAASLTVPPNSIGRFLLNHAALATGDYNANITIKNRDGKLPGELNISVVLSAADLELEIISPTSASPLMNVKTGQEIEIIASPTYNGISLATAKDWGIKIGGKDCENLEYEYDSANEYWIINCNAPNLSDAEYYNLEAAITGIQDWQLIGINGVESNAIHYLDITPPVFVSITSNSIEINRHIDLIADASDNDAVNNVVAEITHPDMTVSQCSMSFVGGFWRCSSPVLNTAGEYLVYYTASDKAGNNNSAGDWFEVYDRYNWNITLSDYNSSPVEGANISLYRPFTGTVLLSDVTDSNGEASYFVNKRHYDIHGEINDSKFIARRADFTDEYSPIDLNFYRFNETLKEKIPMHRFNEFNSFGIVAESDRLNNTQIDFIFNYSSVKNSAKDLGNLKIVKCSSWDYVNNTCLGSWETLTSIRNIGAETITANSTGFSAYFLAENSCGTLGCEPAFGETKDNCGDCSQYGPHTDPNGGGGGGGGGVPMPPITDNLTLIGGIKIYTTSIYEEIFPGESYTAQIRATNTLNTSGTLSLGKEGNIADWISFEETIELKGEEEKEALLLIEVPEDTTPGDYEGNLTLSSGGKVKKMPITLRILSGENSLKAEVYPMTSKIRAGKTLELQTKITNLGDTEVSGILELQLVVSETGEIITRKEETFSVNTTLEENKELKIPIGTEKGKYFIKAIASYEVLGREMEATSIAEIEVLPYWLKEFVGTPLWLLVILIVLAIGCLVIIYYILMFIRKKRNKGIKKHAPPPKNAPKKEAEAAGRKHEKIKSEKKVEERLEKLNQILKRSLSVSDSGELKKTSKESIERIKKAERLISKLRERGHKDKFVKELFLRKGWPEKLIDRMLAETKS